MQTISASIEGSLPEHTERWQAEKRESVVKYGEIIADNLSKAGFSWGCVATVDREGRTIWVVAAERNAQRFIVHADEKLTAFLELERVTRESFRFQNAE